MTYIRTLLAAAAVVLLPFASSAADSVADAEAFVRELAAEAIEVHDNFSAAEDRNGALYDLVARGFDLNAIGGYVLGGHWPKADAQTKADFIEAFAGYLVVTYAERLAADPAARVVIIASEPLDEDAVVVRSRLEPGSGEPLPVEWRMRIAANGWRIVDVSIGGVSMAKTYRDQFASVMRSSGGRIAMLSEKLRQKSQALAQ
jgi:phospholipid transport system substrate-binding protein